MINPSKRQELKHFLEEHSFSPSKKMGQNFLVDETFLEKIVSSGNLSKNDSVIEVGAGTGNLTIELAKKSKKVLAIEKDKKLLPFLEKFTSRINNIKIVNEDILSFKIPFKEYKVIANVPYYITSPIIRKFLEEENSPSLIILTVQKEVAQRILAKPPRMNLLSVSVQFFATPKIVSHIPPSAFYPSPKVTSSILQIIPYNKENRFDKKFNKRFFALVRAGFSHPRKQLWNNISGLIGKDKIKLADIDPKRRAETLSIKEWITLTNLIK